MSTSLFQQQQHSLQQQQHHHNPVEDYYSVPRKCSSSNGGAVGARNTASGLLQSSYLGGAGGVTSASTVGLVSMDQVIKSGSSPKKVKNYDNLRILLSGSWRPRLLGRRQPGPIPVRKLLLPPSPQPPLGHATLVNGGRGGRGGGAEAALQPAAVAANICQSG